jgi:thymidylate synthase
VATVIECDTLRNSYRSIVRRVLECGEPSAPRGLPTRDLGPTLLVIENLAESLPLGLGRGVDPRIAAVEATFLIGGFCDEQLIERVAPRLLDYADEVRDPLCGTSRKLHGAYGRRIGHQLGQALHKITTDPSTRQAVITLWDPWLDNLPGYRDYPCTTSLQFGVRNGRLDLNVTMRSNDVWRGLAYDGFQFSQLLLTAARVLHLLPGRYHHMAWSLHLYDTDVAAAERLLVSAPSGVFDPEPSAVIPRTYQPNGLGRPGDNLAEVQRRARALAAGARVDGMTVSERWFSEYLTAQLTPHVG